MYLIYNETGRALKLNTNCNGEYTDFQISIANADGEFTEFNTITTITDSALANIITGFCAKCSDVINKTSRFFFRHPEKKITSYNTETCEVVTYDKGDVAASDKDGIKAITKNPRNCIIMVLNNDSYVKVPRNIMSGHIPAKTIHTNEYKILIMFARANNWAIGKKPSYIYVNGVDGKKQIRLAYVKTGPNKEFTTNNLFEEDFEGDEFPEDNKPHHKKRDNNWKPANDDKVINRPTHTAYNKVYDNDIVDDNGGNYRRGNKRGNPNHAKKNRHRVDKFDKFN